MHSIVLRDLKVCFFFKKWPLVNFTLRQDLMFTTELFCDQHSTIQMFLSRYYSVVYPLERKLSLFKGAMMVAYTWTHAVLISLPKLFVAGVSPVTSCVEQWPSRQQAQIYLVIYMSLTIFAPLLLTCVAYYLVWRGFRSSHRRVNIKGSSGPRRNKPGSANMAQAAVRERRLMHTLLLMVTCFVALWAARVVSLFMRFFSTAALSEYFVLTAFWISKIEPVVDPIIYGYLNKHFRKHLRELIRVCSIHCETEIGLDEIITSDDGEMDNGRSPVVTPQPLPADEILDTPDPEEAALRSHCRRVSLVSNVYTGPGYTFSFAAGAVGMQTTVESARTLPSGPTGSSDRYRKKSRFTKRLMHSKKVNPEAGTSVKIPTIHIEDTQHGEVLFRVNLADHLPFKSHANDLAANTTTAWPADTAVSSYTSTSYPSRLPPLGKPLSKILPPFPLPVPATLSQLNTHTAPPTPKTGTKRKRRKILNKRIEERRHKLQDNTAL